MARPRCAQGFSTRTVANNPPAGETDSSLLGSFCGDHDDLGTVTEEWSALGAILKDAGIPRERDDVWVDAVVRLIAYARGGKPFTHRNHRFFTRFEHGGFEGRLFDETDGKAVGRCEGECVTRMETRPPAILAPASVVELESRV